MTNNQSTNTVSNPSINTPSNQGTTPSSPYGSMDQISSGPAGELYTIADELIKIYNELEELYFQMTKAETLVQRDTIGAGAKAQAQAASDEAWAIGCQAAGSLMSAGITIFTTMKEATGSKTDIEDLGKQQNKLDEMNKLAGMKQDENATAGNVKPDENTPAKLRGKEMLDGNYGLDDTDPEKQAAIDAMGGDYQAFKDKLREDIATQYKIINTTQSRISSAQQTWQQRGTIMSGFTNSSSQGGQAIAKNLEGMQQAGQQVAGGVEKMADGTANTTRQQIGQYYGEVGSVLNAAKSGANAYAQT